MLGFYFQTEMGKNLPNRKRNGTYVDPNADKDDHVHFKTSSDKEDEKDRRENMKKRDAAENKAT